MYFLVLLVNVKRVENIFMQHMYKMYTKMVSSFSEYIHYNNYRV